MTQQTTTPRRPDRRRLRPAGRGATALAALLATAGVAAGTVALTATRHDGGAPVTVAAVTAVTDVATSAAGQQVGDVRTDPASAGTGAQDTARWSPSDGSGHDGTLAAAHRSGRIGSEGITGVATRGPVPGTAAPVAAALAAGPSSTAGAAAAEGSTTVPDGTANGLDGRRPGFGDGPGAAHPAGPSSAAATTETAAEPAATPGANPLATTADPDAAAVAPAAAATPTAVAPPTVPSPGPTDAGADLFAPATVPTAVAGAEEARALALLDASRAAAGVGALGGDAELRQAAQAWADHLAATGTFQHQPLGPLLGRFTTAAENLALAADVDAAHAALLGSPGHLANLLDARFRVVGIGVAHAADGSVIVCQLFAA